LKVSRKKTPEKQGIAFESLKGEKTPESRKSPLKVSKGKNS